MGFLIAVAIILAVVSAGGIIFILARKFPQIAIINIETIPEEREAKRKEELLLERFQRRRSRAMRKLLSVLNPLGKLIQYGFREFHAYVDGLERKHRAKKAKQGGPETISVDAILKEANELAENEEFEQAENKFIEAIRMDSKNPEAYRGLGDLYMAKRDFVHAKETLEFLIKLGKADSRIYANLGTLAREEGNLEEAKEDLLKSITMESKLASAYIDLGLVYKSLGEQNKTMDAFVRAVEIEPANPKYLDFLLEESIIIGNKNMAEEAFLKLREANPENQKLKDFRKRIDEI